LRAPWSEKVNTSGSSAKIRAVPFTLVNIEVHHRDPRDSTRALQHADGHRDIIEHAEAFAMIGKGVMSATGEVDAQPGLERVLRCFDRALHRPERPLPQLGTPGKAEAARLRRREGAVEHGLGVVRGVGQLQGPALDPVRLLDAFWWEQPTTDDGVPDPGVLGDRKAVAGGQVDRVPGGRPRAHG